MGFESTPLFSHKSNALEASMQGGESFGILISKTT